MTEQFLSRIVIIDLFARERLGSNSGSLVYVSCSTSPAMEHTTISRKT